MSCFSGVGLFSSTKSRPALAATLRNLMGAIELADFGSCAGRMAAKNAITPRNIKAGRDGTAGRKCCPMEYRPENHGTLSCLWPRIARPTTKSTPGVLRGTHGGFRREQLPDCHT